MALSAEIEALLSEARAWADSDIDDKTKAATLDLLSRAEQGESAAEDQLRDAFSGRLTFGTAGLRGELGPGPRRMNRVVVSQTSAGFATFLLARAKAGEATTPPSVVIGYDGRVNSDIFARDTAEIMAGAGLEVTLLREPGPTPLTAFAVRHLGTSAGVMITASHNPPNDNGYKVYLGDADEGAQIVPPVDREIAARIDTAALIPLGDLPRSDTYRVGSSEIADSYVALTAASVLNGLETASAVPGQVIGGHTDLKIVYTAMHGVGSDIGRRVFTAAGLPHVNPVAEQDRPDGAFPTVAFPNPEEPGALDLAYRDALEQKADLIVAHDPDADRLAIAVPGRHISEGFRRLSGNELGLLLGWRAAEREQRRADCAADGVHGALACTIVSSPALRAVAEAYGLDYAETLSGFKWVARVPDLIFGFEEAIGYLTYPNVVRDKDGISASADAIAMVRECVAGGRTVWDLLDDASELFGHFASGQITLRLESMAAASTLAARVRQSPPTSFGDVSVSSARDLLQPGLAAVPADVLRYDLADGSRVMIRPSGTEPKLKIYLDTFSEEGDAAERRATAETALAQLEASVRKYLEQV